MEKIGDLAGRLVSRQRSLVSSQTNNPTSVSLTELPGEFDIYVDRELPDQVVCFWFGAGAYARSRPELRRELTSAEIGKCEARIALLRSALVPNQPSDRKRLAAAIAGMLGAFPMTQRYDTATIAAMTVGYLSICREVPAWAIERACLNVRTGKAGLNPAYCPSEPEFVLLCGGLVRNYRVALERVEGLINAPVQTPSPPKPDGARKTAAGSGCDAKKPSPPADREPTILGA